MADPITNLRTDNELMIDLRVKKLVLNNKQMISIRDTFLQSLKDGLSRNKRKESSIQPYPTYVNKLPNGSESGSYLAIDLGGTNMRVLLVQLQDGQSKQALKKVPVPQAVMTGTGSDLFGFMADAVKEFVDEQGLQDVELHLGFTFSFPVNQTGIASGTLMRWTKGYVCEDVVGNDVCSMLRTELEKRGLNVVIDALVNDTTGTLVAAAWKDPNSCIGLIVGTGSNACYVEKTKNLTFLEVKRKLVTCLNDLNFF